MTPKAVFRTYDVVVTGENQLNIGGMEIQSKQLSMHIKGCKQASVFAATLGAKVDLLIQWYNILDMSKAVILQACAATAIEEYCDQRQEEIQAEAAEQGLYVRAPIQSRLWGFSHHPPKGSAGIIGCAETDRADHYGQLYVGAVQICDRHHRLHQRKKKLPHCPLYDL